MDDYFIPERHVPLDGECPFYRDGQHRWVPNPDKEGPDGDQSDCCNACGVGR